MYSISCQERRSVWRSIYTTVDLLTPVFTEVLQSDNRRLTDGMICASQIAFRWRPVACTEAKHVPIVRTFLSCYRRFVTWLSIKMIMKHHSDSVQNRLHPDPQGWAENDCEMESGRFPLSSWFSGTACMRSTLMQSGNVYGPSAVLQVWCSGQNFLHGLKRCFYFSAKNASWWAPQLGESTLCLPMCCKVNYPRLLGWGEVFLGELLPKCYPSERQWWAGSECSGCRS